MKFPQFKRPVLNRTVYIALFSAYIAVFLNLAFYNQVMHSLPLDSARNMFVFFSMPVVSFCVMNAIITTGSFIFADKLLIGIFVLLSASAQYFIWNYGVVIDRSMITNIIDTTPSETFALLSVKMILTIVFSGVIIIALAFWIKTKKQQKLWVSLSIRVLSILGSTFVIILVSLLFYKDYASLFRNQKELIKSLSPSNSIVATISWYNHNKTSNLPLEKIGLDAHLSESIEKGSKKNLTILVVGETTRSFNFQLNGYSRETNPLLSQDDITYFPNTVSCGTATAVSLPCMFSNMPRTQYDDQLASHQEGLLDIIQRAGLKVLWNDNDGGCKGACDRVPSKDATSLNIRDMCHNGECYDDILFNGLDDYINSLQSSSLIVLHTIGSHGPTYYNRYPQAFRKFTPTCDTNQIQDCTKQQLVNTYDNGILYVDYIVDKAIKLLKYHDKEFTTSLVYLSDHGESLGENGTYLHGLPYSIAPDEQKRVPMLIWLSEDYRKRFRVDKTCLDSKARKNSYSQDNLFSTMLGLTGVQTSVYKQNDDILHGCYR